MMKRGMTLGDTLGALKNMSPNPSPHRQMYRSNSFTSRTEASRRSRHDENSVMFHDDNTILSNYDYSLAGSLAGHSKGSSGRSGSRGTGGGLADLLGGLKPMNADELHDSFSLYTSNTPVPTEEELLEEAIRKGAALASQEDQDTVVSMKDFSKYRSSLMTNNSNSNNSNNKNEKKQFELVMEPEDTPEEAPLINRWSSNSHMKHQQPTQSTHNTNNNTDDLKERKMHRQQSRRALAEKKTGRKLFTEEESSHDPEDMEYQSQSHNSHSNSHSNSKLHTKRNSAGASRASKQSVMDASLTSTNHRTSNTDKRRFLSRCASQPSVMSTTRSLSTWDPESSIPTITAGNMDAVPTAPKTHRARGRPPVTRNHRASTNASTSASTSAASGQDSLNDDSVASSAGDSKPQQQGRGRSRSMGKTLKNVTRSLSRVANRIRGKDGDTSEEEEQQKTSKRKKECTCPAEDVMLTSCPRHGEKAAKILAKRKAKEEKKEKERIKKEQAKKAKEEKKRNNGKMSASSRRGRERGRTGSKISASLNNNTNANDILLGPSHTTHDGINHARRHTAAEC